MLAHDLSRSIDYPETRDEVDTGRLAYWGVSWGGRMGPLMLAVEQRFKTAVLYVAPHPADQGIPRLARPLPWSLKCDLPTSVPEPGIEPG